MHRVDTDKIKQIAGDCMYKQIFVPIVLVNHISIGVPIDGLTDLKAHLCGAPFDFFRRPCRERSVFVHFLVVIFDSYDIFPRSHRSIKRKNIARKTILALFYSNIAIT